MNSFFLTVLSFSILLLHPCATETEGNRSLQTAQYNYMEHLRRATHDMGIKGTYVDDSEPANDQAPGTLLATSFKDTHIAGGRMDIGSYTSTVTLLFTVPHQKEIKAIGKSEIWIFPSLETPLEEGWYKLTLALVITMPDFNKPVEADKIVYWHSTDDCIMIDVTGQTKSIARKLSKRSLNETLVTVEVSIIDKLKLIRNLPKKSEWHQTCLALSPRNDDNSFLVVKYYSDKEINESRPASVEKRSIENSNSSGGCQPVPFYVNLKVIYGDWIVSPRGEVDIQACSGTCDIVDDYRLFSSRAFLKHRLRNVGNSISVPSKLNLDVSCTPLDFEHLVLLIYVNTGDYYVLVEYPVKVKTCGCQ